MKDKNKDKELRNILSKVFPKSKIPANINDLKIGDLKSWDSLGNVNLLLEVEKKYKIKFKSYSFLNTTSIKIIKKLILQKKNNYNKLQNS